MAEKSQLKSGVILSYINLIIGNIVPLFYTPIMLRIMGQSEYGLFALASSVTSYLSLISLGIGSAVVRYLIKFRAKGDTDGESRMLGLFFLVFSVFSIIVLFAGTILSFNVNEIYDQALTLDELFKMRILILIISFNMAISLVFSVFTSVIVAHERFIFQQCLNISTTIIPSVLNIVVLSMGFASIGIAICSLILTILTNIIYTFYCYKKIKIRPVFRDMPFYLIKEIVTFSFFVFLANVVNILHASTDKVIIGAKLGTASTAVYNIGLTFSNIIMSISVTMSTLLTPKITALVDSGASKDELTSVLIKVGRLQFLMLGLIVGGFATFGRPFIHIYAGPEYSLSFPVALLLIVPSIVPLIQNVALSIIMALNKHKARSLVNLGTAILNVFFTIYLIPYWGIVGAAFTTFCCNIIGSVLFMNWYYYKVVKLDIPKFWKEIIRLMPVPIILTVIGLLTGIFVNYSNIIIFIIAVLIYTLLYISLIWHKLNEYELGIIKGLFNKVIKIFKHNNKEEAGQ